MTRSQSFLHFPCHQDLHQSRTHSWLLRPATVNQRLNALRRLGLLPQMGLVPEHFTKLAPVTNRTIVMRFFLVNCPTRRADHSVEMPATPVPSSSYSAAWAAGEVKRPVVSWVRMKSRIL